MAKNLERIYTIPLRNVKNVKITDYSSEIYTNAEIESAIAVAIDYFKKNFEGCTLTEITYLGDDKNEDWKEVADRNNATDTPPSWKYCPQCVKKGYKNK